MLSLAIIVILLLQITNEQIMNKASKGKDPGAMCPCVQTSQETCQQFDKRYQAHTIEDAIDSFSDLTLYHSAIGAPEDEDCETEECSNCRLLLRGKMIEVGLVEESPLASYAPMDLSNKTCDRYRFSMKEDKARRWLQAFYYLLRNEAFRYPQARIFDIGLATFHSIFEQQIIEIERMITENDLFMDDEPDWSKPDETKKKNKNKKDKRPKRQSTAKSSSSTDNSIIGERTKLQCTGRGYASDATGRVSLCSMCWVIRTLPDNYSPKIINELICDNSDTACLSGYATCSVGTHKLDVVRNDSGVLHNVVLTAGSYCECRPMMNSAIYSLVLGAGTKDLPSLLANSSKKGK